MSHSVQYVYITLTFYTTFGTWTSGHAGKLKGALYSKSVNVHVCPIDNHLRTSIAGKWTLEVGVQTL